MFDIGGLELLLIAIVGLLVIGPERLPETLRTLGLWLGRLRRSFTSVKAEIEKEIGMDEVRRQLHNEAIMEDMKKIERDVKSTMQEPVIDPNAAATAPKTTEEADGPDPVEPPPAVPIPPTDAELEASYERKQAKLAAQAKPENAASDTDAREA